MVMGDDSCLRGHRFESHDFLLDGHFFTLNCCKNCIVCSKRLKTNEKEAGIGPFKKTWSCLPFQSIMNLNGSRMLCYVTCL